MKNSSDYPFDGTRPAQVVLDDFYDTVEDTMRLSTTSFPTWNRQTEDGVRQVTCSVSPDVSGQFFSITLRGGAVSDPVGVADAVQEEWKSRGWQLGPRFEDAQGAIPGVQISGVSPTGMDVVVRPSSVSTRISIESDCTADPAASVRPTPSSP
ncbi:hypothetical protein ODZ83_03315 [Acaricomes phytoseiuli]|uniref:hypothetical protein n=1 Tax=Acaricomes phytoseiuli TaxID=291968 RepID=UPI00047798B8|nr:hypothetical protein [Acaricomes phytoseiuli]MCW1249228.1 hypothetical protein [Acaricomes phytoseiuli]